MQINLNAYACMYAVCLIESCIYILFTCSMLTFSFNSSIQNETKEHVKTDETNVICIKVLTRTFPDPSIYEFHDISIRRR